MGYARRLGRIASTGVALVGFAYLVILGIGLGQAGLEDPIRDPVLAAMELLTMLSALFFFGMIAAICAMQPLERKRCSGAALLLAVLFAGLTCAVHVYALTAGRAADAALFDWPSTPYALELLAWDGLLGVSLLLVASLFPGSGLRRAARISLGTTGVLCLLGGIGPLVGDMAVQRLGIVGYAIGLPVSSLILMRWFRREA